MNRKFRLYVFEQEKDVSRCFFIGQEVEMRLQYAQ